ncbi:hypothetical protein AURDEDRAFT_166529 [Auricularia subglabra TFB-10046 SS5]|nr:hypothetical protein AURDEDRAFT_166529 [Auricularia subglabra TFB-10046 SS5]
MGFHTFSSSSDAQSLREFTANILESWLSGATAGTEVNALFKEITNVFNGALAAFAMQWNAEHDPLRVLPSEIRDLCMVSLPALDKYQLGAVRAALTDGIFGDITRIGKSRRASGDSRSPSDSPNYSEHSSTKNSKTLLTYGYA